MSFHPETFVALDQVILHKAAANPQRTACIFLADGFQESARWTYGDLAARIRAIAAALRQRCGDATQGGQRERVLLVFEPSLEFVAAFVGCLHAGLTAVPVYPPEPSRALKTLPRFQAVVQDAGCRVALTSASLMPLAGQLAQLAPELGRVHFMASDALDLAPLPHDHLCDHGPADIALLQYTSGSTATPKGAMVSHAALAHNIKIAEDFGCHSDETVMVSWLPPYHDMGLIGGILQPLSLGALSVLMPPMAFLKRPLAWLQAISRYRGTSSPAPNFAFELCQRKVRAEDLAALDLSSWQFAWNGAEPIRADTLERFQARFEASGFRRAAMCPCYGLAEATLIVSGVGMGIAPTYLHVAEESYAQGRILPVPEGGPHAQTLVGCGPPLPTVEVAIVEVDGSRPLAEGEVGEICVAGPSIASGYWQRTQEHAATFEAYTSDGRGPWLRTGDLGAMWQGQLYISGRLKDLIIIRGRNIYPQDIERTVEQGCAAVRPGCVAAFSVATDGEEQLVVAVETDSTAPAADQLLAMLRVAVSQAHDIRLHALALLPAGGLPKTTSGKLQRQRTRFQYLAGHWPSARN